MASAATIEMPSARSQAPACCGHLAGLDAMGWTSLSNGAGSLIITHPDLARGLTHALGARGEQFRSVVSLVAKNKPSVNF
jgi:hypothetical protein